MGILTIIAMDLSGVMRKNRHALWSPHVVLSGRVTMVTPVREKSRWL